RLGVALELERAPPRDVGVQLEAVAEAELLRPLPVGRSEVADEAGDDVEVGRRERLEKRPRTPLAEKAPGVGDPEALRRAVVDPGEVVEVAAVRDRPDRASRLEPPRLPGNRPRRVDDRVGV